VQHRPCTDTEG